MKTRIASLTLSAGLCFLAGSPALASTWNYIGGSDSTFYFFDADTVEKSDKNVTVWIKTVQTEQLNTDGSWAMALRWKMNCSKRTYQSLAFSTYDKDGKFIQSFSDPSTESPVVPDTTTEAMLKIACEPTFPHDTSGKKYVKVPNNDIFQFTKVVVKNKKSQKDVAPLASTWNYIGSDGAFVFFDADTVEKSDKNVTVWLKRVQTEQPDTDGSWATAMHWKINCSKRTYQSLAFSTYDKDGKFIQSFSDPGSERPVVFGTTAEAMLKIACEPTFPRDTSGEKYIKVPNNDIFQFTRDFVEYEKSRKDLAPQ